jgi:predicted helicase
MPVRQAPRLLKPAGKAIKEYYQTLETYRAHGARHEGALETAFQHLLADTARPVGWTLIPKKLFRLNGTSLYPDGTLFDEFNLPRGYWEAKDLDDNLEVQIRKKIDKGYPLTNTIFEDTERAVLFQDKREVLQVDLTDARKLVGLLNQFYAWTKPEYAKFHRAIEDFQDRVPDLARGLADKLREAHAGNGRFRAAFANFFALCQTTLNPNIRQEAVDEMLVQHLLTERIIRNCLDNPGFTRRNVIAVEVEKVIAALVGKTFSRDEFQKSLEPFYRAIEGAARTIPEFSDKQHFLRTIYERFFQGYSVKLADTHGIVYTPEQIVDFMCASVEEILRKEFGLTLGSPEVTILDPCTGTGNFVRNLISRVPGKDLPRVYKEQLFANEVMLLPYYISALNIEHAYYERTKEYEPFEGMCFVDTLDLAEEQGTFSFMTEKNTERVERQKRTPVTVIIGNPPYNVGQLDENDNNKNREYRVIEKRIRETYAKDSAATNMNALWDAYVKFFRWTIDRLEDRDGIVCLVTNNSFVDQIAFDGMRKHLLQDFNCLYHLHLEGNVRHNPKLAGTTYNVFGIQVGVGITIAVRSARHTDHCLYFHRVDKLLRREEKLDWLDQRKNLSGVVWQLLKPDDRHTWLVPGNADEFTAFLPIASKATKEAKASDVQAVFKLFSVGVKTNRDEVVYDFNRPALVERIKQFIEDYNGEVDRYKRSGGKANVDEFVRYDKIKWSRDLKLDLQRGRYAGFSEEKIRTCLYRPLDLFGNSKMTAW